MSGPETPIENALVTAVENEGGLAMKFVSPGYRGVPDRLLLLGMDGAARMLQKELANVGQSISHEVCYVLAAAVVSQSVRFAECKAPGEKPEPHQVRMHAKLRALGYEVDIVDEISD